MYKPLPKELRLGFSDIHDIGLFAKEKISKATNLGMSHIQISDTIVRTPLGGFINHSEQPNCYIDTSKGDRTLHTVIPVRKGDELTVYYRFKGYDGTVGDDTDVEIHN